MNGRPAVIAPAPSWRVVIYSEATAFAGAERVVATLVGALPEAVEVTVAGPHRPTVSAIAGSRGRVVTMPALARRQDLASVWALRRRLAALAPAVLHLNKTDVAGLRYVEAVAHTIPGLRPVSVVHHVEPVATPAGRLLTRSLARRASVIVAVSHRLAQQLEEILGLPPGRVATVLNAVPPPSYRRQPDPGRPFTVGVLSRLVGHKAVDDVVRAVATLDGAHLLIGGDGPERPRLEQLSRQLGLAHRTRFLGWVDPEAVLAHCDVLASVARIEGHPLTLLDAQAIGLPVVAADVGGVDEIVGPDPAGILVRPGDVAGLAAALRLVAHHSPAADPPPASTGDDVPGEAGHDTPGEAGHDTVAAMARAYQALYWPGGAAAPPDRTANRPAGRAAQDAGGRRG